LYSANNLIKITEVLSFVHLPALQPSFFKGHPPLSSHPHLQECPPYSFPFADGKPSIELFHLSIGHHYMPKKKGFRLQNDYLEGGDLCSVQS
jgi:hypothetical protein